MNPLIRFRSLNLFSLTRTVLRSQPRTFHLLRPFCSEPEEDAVEKLKSLTEEYEKCVEEKQDFKDKYMRALADMENLRKRSQKQVDDTKIFAVQSFCKDLLEVADVLDMALEAVKKEKDEANMRKNIDGLQEGVKMTKDVLLKTFAKHGLVPVNPDGHPFDPNVHDALFEIPHHQTHVKPGHVAQVMKIGYSLHNRPIRPAKVAVVKEPNE